MQNFLDALIELGVQRDLVALAHATDRPVLLGVVKISIRVQLSLQLEDFALVLDLHAMHLLLHALDNSLKLAADFANSILKLGVHRLAMLAFPALLSHHAFLLELALNLK